MLVHNVYFSLNDASESAVEHLLTSCRKYLTNHPGIVFFACGRLAADMRRDVNDLDFEVGLHMVFKDKAAHDVYQVAPLHEQFIEECKGNWKRVRVFDSVAEVTPIPAAALHG
jgi:hypothetical protein